MNSAPALVAGIQPSANNLPLPSSTISHSSSVGARTSQSLINTSAELQNINTFKISGGLEQKFKKPQQMNINEIAPFTAFQQSPGKLQSDDELPKSTLEIDLGRVNHVKPITTNEDITNFFGPSVFQVKVELVKGFLGLCKIRR